MKICINPMPIMPMPTLLYLLFLFPLALSEIKTTSILSDSRRLILFEQFGYSPSGVAAVSIRSFSSAPPTNRTSLMGFFLVPEAHFPRIANESYYTSNFCPLSSHFSLPILTFDHLRTASETNHSIDVTSPDEYSLLFANCVPNITQVTMSVRTEMYNWVIGTNGHDDHIKDYLPTGKSRLPAVYLGFFLVYCVFFVGWVVVCYKQRMTVERIHLVMGALLLFKGLKLACAAEDLWHVKGTGTPHGWDVAFYVFGFFKGVLLFTVIVLIGTGWSFLKPYLQDREKNVLMVVIPMQVIENIASAIIGETGPAERDWLTWNQIFLLVDIVCCCAVFFPIIWSIRSLREASKTDGKAARNLQKLTLFKQFYVVVVGYLYFTRIVASALGALLNYRYRWGVTAAVEAASLAFYVFVFYNFQPVDRNPYLHIGDEEEEAAGGVLEMEEAFEL